MRKELRGCCGVGELEGHAWEAERLSLRVGVEGDSGTEVMRGTSALFGGVGGQGGAWG